MLCNSPASSNYTNNLQKVVQEKLMKIYAYPDTKVSLETNLKSVIFPLRAKFLVNFSPH